MEFCNVVPYCVILLWQKGTHLLGDAAADVLHDVQRGIEVGFLGEVLDTETISRPHVAVELLVCSFSKQKTHTDIYVTTTAVWTGQRAISKHSMRGLKQNTHTSHYSSAYQTAGEPQRTQLLGAPGLSERGVGERERTHFCKILSFRHLGFFLSRFHTLSYRPSFEHRLLGATINTKVHTAKKKEVLL